MGHYINPGIEKFKKSVNSKIYVDKSSLILQTNELVDTEQRFICISRPRRFGKTMAANMLAAYYGAGEDANPIFENLAIAQDPFYKQYLNQYNVLMINMQEFLSKTNSVKEMLTLLQSTVTSELMEEFPEVMLKRPEDFIAVMKDIYTRVKCPFIILIDEWDCLFREYKDDIVSQKEYLDFLRLWLKDQAYVGLAYMTGILPIKKYGSHSALNMFDEYSMIKPYRFLEYFGFKYSEVTELAREFKVDIDEIKKWYNGYFVDREQPIYNPRSVKSYLLNGEFDNYWNKTETYEALQDYIKLNFDGLKDKITLMISGKSVKVNPNKFTNDMTTFNSADDVLTLLTHLGYLTYNFDEKTIRIPNEEVRNEFINAIEDLNEWHHVIETIQNSDNLLKAIWNNEPDLVSEEIERAHELNTSILQYNDENSLSCMLALALFSASEYYTTFRELPTGKGFSDLVLIPRKKYLDKPAMIIELKWDKNAQGAIDQIRSKNYPTGLEEYQDNLLLIGINYDKSSKKHECYIEKY